MSALTTWPVNPVTTMRMVLKVNPIQKKLARDTIDLARNACCNVCAKRFMRASAQYPVLCIKVRNADENSHPLPRDNEHEAMRDDASIRMRIAVGL
ncbi:hypothetical protein K9U39_05890 [Rhodoblastus acidophilus]|nr:hypothetical protein [Rhodoblastus acidophilus]